MEGWKVGLMLISDATISIVSSSDVLLEGVLGNESEVKGEGWVVEHRCRYGVCGSRWFSRYVRHFLLLKRGGLTWGSRGSMAREWIWN